jgi:hypothetical protein
MALAAYFVSSALAGSVHTRGAAIASYNPLSLSRDGRALAEELRVAGDRDVRAPEKPSNPTGRADGHRRLGHDDTAGRQRCPHLGEDGPHRAQVGATVVAHRSGHAQQDHVSVADGVAKRRGHPEPSGRQPVAQQLVQAWLVERHPTLAHGRDLRRVVVDAHDPVT